MSTGTQPIQPNNDALTIAMDALKQSGGDAKAAFYNLAKQKGADPDQTLKQIQAMGDLKSVVMNMFGGSDIS